jgi:arginine:pyruvate transaminase
MPGASFGDAARGHVRVSLCQPEERLADAARRIGAVVRNYKAG